MTSPSCFRFVTSSHRKKARNRAGLSASAIEPALGETEEALRQEDDHHDEDETERDQIGELLAEQASQQLAQQQEEPGAYDRTDQGTDPAHDIENHGLARNQKVDEIRRGKAVLQRVEHAGES